MATPGNAALEQTVLAPGIRFDEQHQGRGRQHRFFCQHSLAGDHFRFKHGAENFHQRHARGASETQSLDETFRYLFRTFADLDILLFGLVCAGRVSLVDANQVQVERRSPRRLAEPLFVKWLQEKWD